MRRLLVRLRRASERGGRDLQQRFSMLTAISVAIAVLASLILTFIPWKHRPVDAQATVAQILADDTDETASTEGGAQ